jgi:hypothetical protein
MFSPPKMDKDKCSRGRSSNTYRYFLEVTKYLEENDDEQVTISQLVARMQTLCGDESYMKVSCKFYSSFNFKFVISFITYLFNSFLKFRLCTEITPRQDVCIICNTETNDGSKIVQLTEKGRIGMNKANKERGDDIVTKSRFQSLN